ncbi:hypothetical protein ACHAWF_004182 [Thalassiosira exigua]
MTLSSFSKKQCKRLNVLHRKTFFPLMKFNRNTPNTIIFGPLDMDGMGISEAEALQAQSSLPYVLRTLQYDKTVANDFLTALDWAQIRSGYVQPILEATSGHLDYIGRGFITYMRRNLDEMDASLWIEKAWTPKLQREGDKSIMERFSQISSTRRQLEKLNAVRLYLRVVTVADLADPTGRYIPDGMLTGDWRAGSDLRWPTQDCPPKGHWALFRKYLRKSFCTGTSWSQPAQYGMSLDTPLGAWLPVRRNTWFQCYRSKDTLFWRNEEGGLQQLKRTRAHAFYHALEEVSSLPLDAHPIKYRQFSELIWTLSRFNMAEGSAPDDPPAGHIVYSTIFDPSCDRIETSSDGSCHLYHQIAGAAWIIEDGDKSKDEACILLHGKTTSCSAFCWELEGMFRSLYHLNQLGLTPKEVFQWCDNERAVYSSNNLPHTPKEVMASDADVIMAIHDLKSRLPFPVSGKHVYDHQDTRGERKKSNTKVRRRRVQIRDERETALASDLSIDTSSTDSSSASLEEEGRDSTQAPINPYAKNRLKRQRREVHNNIRCDEMASETTKIAMGQGVENLPAMPKTLEPPFQGSRAMLKIAGRWVTSDYKRHIYTAFRRLPMIEYMKGQYGWSDGDIGSIDWATIGQVRTKMSIKWRHQISKIMHCWLPTMHMRRHVTGLNQCPG